MVKLTELPPDVSPPIISADSDPETDQFSDAESDAASSTSSTPSLHSLSTDNGPIIPSDSAALIYNLYLYTLKYPLLTLLPLYIRSAIKTSLALTPAGTPPSVRHSFRSTRFSVAGYLYFVLYYLATSKGCLPNGPLQGAAFGKNGEEVTAGIGLRFLIFLVRVLAGRAFVGSVSRSSGRGLFEGGKGRLWRDAVSLFALQKGVTFHRSVHSGLGVAPMMEWISERLLLGGLESGVMRVVAGADESVWGGMRNGGRWGVIWRSGVVELGGLLVGLMGEGVTMGCEVGIWRRWGVTQNWMEGWEK
jgi:hypothetical protein